MTSAQPTEKGRGPQNDKWSSCTRQAEYELQRMSGASDQEFFHICPFMLAAHIRRFSTSDVSQIIDQSESGSCKHTTFSGHSEMIKCLTVPLICQTNLFKPALPEALGSFHLTSWEILLFLCKYHSSSSPSGISILPCTCHPSICPFAALLLPYADMRLCTMEGVGLKPGPKSKTFVFTHVAQLNRILIKSGFYCICERGYMYTVNTLPTPC